MYFSTEIPTLIIYLLALAAFFAAVALVYGAVQSFRIVRARRFCEAIESTVDMAYEPVSVIVYSQDEAEALDELLRSILSQDYPAQMEVVVVNEGDTADVRDVVATLRHTWPNLYLTHTPDGARSLSRKKLGVTLGIKAARYDTVVLTTVGAQIRSDKWLRAMMRHFSPDSGVEVVLGFAAQMPDADSGRGARCRAFDSAYGAARWLGAAIGGHPFRATELNVAYRREAFFRNKGFSRSLNLHFGDDDIFISEIARKDNTAVELSADSIVGILVHDFGYVLRQRAVRHVFTESHIPRRPRFWASAAAWSVLLSVACATAAVAMDCLNGATVALAAACVLILAAGLTAAWRRVLSALEMRLLAASIFPLAVGYPLRRAMLRVRARFCRQKRYTWD